MTNEALVGHPQLAVRRLCELLAVSRSWFYAAQHVAPAAQDSALRAAIEQIVLEFAGYG